MYTKTLAFLCLLKGTENEKSSCISLVSPRSRYQDGARILLGEFVQGFYSGECRYEKMEKELAETSHYDASLTTSEREKEGRLGRSDLDHRAA